MIEVIPSPRLIQFDAGQFRFRAGTPVCYSDGTLAAIAEHFCRDVTQRTGLRPELSPDGRSALRRRAPSVCIEIVSDADVIAMPNAVGAPPSPDVAIDERYALTIGVDRAIVRAAEAAGAARGLATLAQIVAHASPDQDGGVSLPGMLVRDAPRLASRGVSVEVLAHCITSIALQHFVDLLALYKLNILQLRLFDRDARFVGITRALQDLMRYAASRFVTVQSEADPTSDANAFQQRHLEGRVDIVLLPRLAAVAERTWCESATPDLHEVHSREGVTA